MTEQNTDYQSLDSHQLAVERTRLAAQRSDCARIRTRLANKRTFLAWSRTALAVMAFGFLLERVDAFILSQQLSTEMRSELSLLGLAAFFFGPLLMVLGAWRYIQLERNLGLHWRDLLIVPELLLFFLVVGLTLYHVFT